MKYINEGMKIKVLDKYAEMKLLDVTFDEHLKFTSHLDELSKRISGKTGVLMRLQNLIPTLAKLRIYKSFILPQSTYCLGSISTVSRVRSLILPGGMRAGSFSRTAAGNRAYLLSDVMAHNSVFIPEDGYLLFYKSGGNFHVNCL